MTDEEFREEAIIVTKNQLWEEGIRDEQRLAVRAIQIVDQICVLHTARVNEAVQKVYKKANDTIEREVEEAKKEERERILKYLKAHNLTEMIQKDASKFEHLELSTEDWQALKDREGENENYKFLPKVG